MSSSQQLLVTLLKELQNTKFAPQEAALQTVSKARQVLSTIVELGRQQEYQFTEAQKTEVGPLLFGAFKAIILCVSHIVLNQVPNPYLEALRGRSAHQFLLDDYKHFPAGNGSRLSDVFDCLDFKDNIESLDAIIDDWPLYHPDSECLEEVREQIITGIPSSHVWWPRNSSKEKRNPDSECLEKVREKIPTRKSTSHVKWPPNLKRPRERSVEVNSLQCRLRSK